MYNDYSIAYPKMQDVVENSFKNSAFSVKTRCFKHEIYEFLQKGVDKRV